MTISTIFTHSQHGLHTLLQFLKLGLRTAFFQRPGPAILETTPVLLLTIVILAELAGILFARLDIKGPAIFYLGAVMWGWLFVVISLWLCWLLIKKTSRQVSKISLAHLFTIVVAQDLIIDTVANIAYLPIAHGDNLVGSKVHWALYGIMLVWGILAFLVLLIRETQPGWRVSVLAITISITMPYLAYAYQQPQYWYADQQEDTSKHVYLELSQENIEKQLQVAEAQRDSLALGQEGEVELFAISFAPYASEDVFLNESIMINNLMRKRFDAAGRNQELINHVKTSADKPWATLENLERAIYQAGKRMNKDEDVLFIYLTSHGSKDFKLSASHWPLQLGELTPQTLSLWLDKAGVKNRVIAVSACYSGGWIDVLKNDYTLVMTAADKDHTSYGCGRKSELTYFGNAVFNEAMRNTLSFEKAFHMAVPVIKKREEEAKKEDGFSNPQIYIGNSIKPILDGLEKQLQSGNAAISWKGK